MGTALTPEQSEKLRRLTDRVVLCYDGDEAGRAATRAAIRAVPRAGAGRRRRPPAGRRGPDDVLSSAGPRSRFARRWSAGLSRLAPERPESERARPRPPPSARRGSTAILEILRAVPDAILRHEECRKVAAAVFRTSRSPLGTDRPRSAAGREPRIDQGTPAPRPVLSDGGIPEAVTRVASDPGAGGRTLSH
jgi:DNA primase